MNRLGVRDWLEARTDLDARVLNGLAIDQLVAERLRACGLSDEAAYVQLLERSPEEVERMIGGVAVAESWLFRYPRSFDLLAAHLASLLVAPPRDPGSSPPLLRMLSIACAAGQEPCSMAITALHAGWPANRVHIDAIDLDRSRIDTARHGQFGAGALRQDLPDWARPWLTTSDDQVQVDSDVLSMIEFRHGNALQVTDLASAGPYDAVFCRNLLIYLSAPAREALVPRLQSWTGHQGLLFVGHAEQIEPIRSRFDPVREPHAFAFRRGSPGTVSGTDQRVETKSVLRPHPVAPQAAPPVRIEQVPDKQRAPRAPIESAAPPPIETVDEARALADRGRLDDALGVLGRMLTTTGPKVDTLELLGNVQLALDQVKEARESFRKAVYLDPEHEGSLLQLALIDERLGEAEAALRYRRRAERAHRKHAASGEASSDQ